MADASDVSNFTPIKMVMDKINSSLGDVAITASSAISKEIMPFVGLCFSIYVILTVVNMMRGQSSEPVLDVWMRFLGFAVIIGIGLNMGNYANYVIPMVTSLGDQLANAITGGASPSSSLDALAQHYVKIIEEDYVRINEMGILDGTDKFVQPILWLAKTVIICIGLVPFLVLAAAALIIAKVGSIIVAAMGPIFFSCLVFPATRQYFSSWLNTAVSYALLPIGIAIIVMFSINISTEIFKTNGSDAFEKMSFVTVLLASIVNILLCVLIKTVQGIASSLSAGGINPGTSGGAVRRAANNLTQKGNQGAKAAGGKAAGGKAEGWAGGIAGKVWNAITKKNNDIKPG
jgi:type IV secretion system protein VirB6